MPPSQGAGPTASQAVDVPPLHDEPVGPEDGRLVRRGDCIAGIAYDEGHSWETLWKHPDNAELKRVRKDPNTLLPGDRVRVPEIEAKSEDKPDAKRYRFRRKAVPTYIKFRVLDDDEPVADTPYRLDVDGALYEGSTDSDGKLKHAVPPGSKRGALYIDRKEHPLEYGVSVGAMPPIDTTLGIKGRLANLGYAVDDRDKDPDEPNYRAALAAFQKRNDLDITGEPDQATRDKLMEFAP